MTLDDMLTLRLQIPQTDNMNYTDSFVQIVDTDNIEDFLQIYRYINIASLKIQGVSIFKNGIKPLTEDAQNTGIRRLKFQAKENPSGVFDHLLQQLISGYLAIEGVNGIEMKAKGQNFYFFVWVEQQHHLKVKGDIEKDFDCDYVLAQPIV
ncbi:Eukaryotic initiation factor 4E-like protein [Spironucleus salmonicida]|uniref:Eukaryotic initiation factor 4E-like protein n=1 Tax=Spironucleus salmonicida TaxID=348837 RepID=V6LMS1_9EUKA|nr:Eukaryotic initiation factor 4E-like protein [Spironucleus salmonicida]KAH0573345.1 Eukaryotic initiation factor 4E-like protein [Spironucleus salmonicida]|eukprot:EST45011.1 Eukaryotic initiation factor 4E-like protein [Spironucleus salmonicida]